MDEKNRLCSRVTTLNLVDGLIEEGRIEDRKEGNSFHQLYYGDKNEFNLIDKDLDEIENIVNMMDENLLKIDDKSNNIDKKLLTAPGPFSDLAFFYLESMYTILRHLLVITQDKVSSNKDSHLLYTKIIRLLLKVNKQQRPRFLRDDKMLLENYSNSLLEIKIRWGLLKRYDRHNILDNRLIDALLKKIDNFRITSINRN